MRKLTMIFGFFIGLSLTIQAQEKPTWTSTWSNGYKVERSDKMFKMKFGGRIMMDWAFFAQDDDIEAAFGELKSGVEFRRLRFFNSGQIYERIKYKVQLDFSGGDISFKDVYMEVTEVPALGNLRIGHFKEPFRLEALTSSKYITLMERSQHIPFSPERNSGIMFHNSTDNGKISWQAGFFRNADSAGDDPEVNGGFNLTARLTGLLMKNDEKKQLLHLGLGFSHRNPDNDSYRVRARPEAHLSSRYVNTGTIDEVDNINLFNVEAAFVQGSFSAQAEYLSAAVSAVEDYSFGAYYGQLSYFLTGESRKLKSSYAGFDRVKPKKNFGSEGGGAWELALRYSSIDLNDADVEGGKLNDITLGLNWYLNPATRMMFNYIYADVKDLGKSSIVQTRFQVDF
jgi:phosphate-selective porin OprO/OprP